MKIEFKSVFFGASYLGKQARTWADALGVPVCYFQEAFTELLGLGEHRHVIGASDLHDVFDPTVLDHPPLELLRDRFVLSAHDVNTRD